MQGNRLRYGTDMRYTDASRKRTRLETQHQVLAYLGLKAAQALMFGCLTTL